MKLTRWLRSLFQTRPLTRDVSRLEADAEQPDAVAEEIDLSGGPLKEHHRRRALRDPRLLPKTRRQQRRTRGKVLPADEAKRLFAGTLRTRNRNIRDLLPDVEQLKRHGLPVWKTETDVADALGITVKALRHFSIHREAERVCHYVTFSIPKRSGGRRQIMAPKRRLKALQRRLIALLVRRLPVSEFAHGFRVGRSVKTGAEKHVGRRVLLQLDLKDFFPSVTYPRVRGLLIALGYGYVVAATLAALMTESERQPVDVEGTVYHVPAGPRHCVQGAPTSPGLCNSVTQKLDHRLAGLARHYGFTYTRYADDLTFSGDDVSKVHALRAFATRIIRDEGFEVNPSKTRIARKGSRQRVTGVTVNDTLGLSRQERRRLRAMIHQTKRDEQSGTVDPHALARVRGKLAYLSMVNPAQATRLRK